MSRMNCETCGWALTSEPITRRLLGKSLGFCSGRCAAVFDRLFPGAEVRTEVREHAVAAPAEGAG